MTETHEEVIDSGKTTLLRETIKQGGYFAIVMAILLFTGWQLDQRVIPSFQRYIEATAESTSAMAKTQSTMMVSIERTIALVGSNADRITAIGSEVSVQREQLVELLKIMNAAAAAMKDVPSLRAKELELIEKSVSILEDLRDQGTATAGARERATE